MYDDAALADLGQSQASLPAMVYIDMGIRPLRP